MTNPTEAEQELENYTRYVIQDVTDGLFADYMGRHVSSISDAEDFRTVADAYARILPGGRPRLRVVAARFRRLVTLVPVEE